MYKKNYLLLGLLMMIFFTPISEAQVQELNLLGNWQNDALPEMAFGRYNEVWGIVVNDVEYAVIGSTMGTHFISLEPNGTTLSEVAFIPGAAQGTGIIHRDFHSYGNYLYAVADEGQSSLQIMDFSGLPETVELVYDSNEFINRTHNIFIDTMHARLYSVNGHVLSLENPEVPISLHNGPNLGHDVYAANNIVFANTGSSLKVYDYTEVTNPVLIGNMTDYINSGYNHSGWPSEDGSHYFLCDETGGAYVKSVDISDFSDMEVVDLFKSDNENPQHIAHNAMVRGNLVYVSYYSDGIQIFDATDPTNVVRKFFYDTYPGINDSWFKGAWGVYCLLPSGKILVSDMASGLYLFSPPIDNTVFPLESDLRTCPDSDLNFRILVGADFDEGGVNLSGVVPQGASITFSENPATPGSIVDVVVSNLMEAGQVEIEITAEDGEAVTMNSIMAEVLPSGEATVLAEPANESVGIPLAPTLNWEANDNGVYLLEFNSSPDFSGEVIFSLALTENNYTIPSELLANTTYYWQITSPDACGEPVSETFSFTTMLIDGLTVVAADAVKLLPNPASTELSIICQNYFQGKVAVQLFDLNGKEIAIWHIKNLDQQFTIQTPVGLHGLYLLQVSDERHTLTRRVLFE